jgi:hypothetical protein
MTFKNFDPLSSGASDDDLRQLIAWAKCDLPAEYLSFLRTTNGGDTRGGLLEYYRFWDAAQIISYNEGYEVGNSLPGFIGIGDDGGPSMFLMKMGTWEIFSYPFSLDNAYAEQVASSFSQLMAHIEALQPGGQRQR